MSQCNLKPGRRLQPLGGGSGAAQCSLRAAGQKLEDAGAEGAGAVGARAVGAAALARARHPPPSPVPHPNCGTFFLSDRMGTLSFL